MRRFALALVALAILFAFGCAGKQSQPAVEELPVAAPEQPPAEKQSAPPQQCSEGNVLQKDECFSLLAVQKNDPEVCKSIYSVEKMDRCYANFANSRLDICKRISDAEMRADCLSANAVLAKSEEICGLIDNAERRADCLQKVLPPCMAILDPAKREECLALEKGDYTICTTDACLRNYALAKKDENACGIVSSPAERYACRAQVRGDVGFCKNAELVPVRDLCAKLASIALDDEKGCAYATVGSDYRNECYLHFAVSKKDAAICARAAPEEKRDWCYSQWASLTANTSSCQKVIETLSRISCYYDAAARNAMASLCNPLEVENQRNDCYSKAVFAKGGPVAEDCGLVVSQEWRDKCYLRAATSSYNSSYCARISPGPDKDSCEQLFGS